MFSESASFVGLTVCAAILWCFGVLTPRPLTCTGALLGLLLVRWLWWRQNSSLRSLCELVQIPEVVDSTSVPNQEQMEGAGSGNAKITGAKGLIYPSPGYARACGERAPTQESRPDVDSYHSLDTGRCQRLLPSAGAPCGVGRGGQYCDVLPAFASWAV
jgi:hypothetical protein